MFSLKILNRCYSFGKILANEAPKITMIHNSFHTSPYFQKGQDDIVFLNEMESEFLYKKPGTWDREVPPLESREFTPRSKRTGVIVVKVGMTQDWDSYGAILPLTVLWIDSCQVTKVKRREIDGVTALQLGCGHVKEKNASTHLKRECECAGVPLKRKRLEFRVSEDALLPLGTEITAAHFVAGQYVDVTGITIGKGFQGVMKRWGFAGGPASHGASKVHRKAGSIGACQDPGRVWKGKKMAGRMGNESRTVYSCWVFKVDAKRNLIYVKGQVPGHSGNFLKVKDATRKPLRLDLPFPTYLDPILPDVQIATPEKNPYHLYEEATKT